MDRYNRLITEIFDKSNYIQQLEIPSYDEHIIKSLSFLINVKINQQFSALKTLHSETDKNKRCYARIHNSARCSRHTKNEDTDFCGSHINSLPYGRIDEDQPELGQLTAKKTRGRKAIKARNRLNTELDQIDLNDYIKTQVINISGNEYLIDENDVIFANDNNNTIVGRKKNNTYEWF